MEKQSLENGLSKLDANLETLNQRQKAETEKALRLEGETKYAEMYADYDVKIHKYANTLAFVEDCVAESRLGFGSKVGRFFSAKRPDVDIKWKKPVGRAMEKVLLDGRKIMSGRSYYTSYVETPHRQAFLDAIFYNIVNDVKMTEIKVEQREYITELICSAALESGSVSYKLDDIVTISSKLDVKVLNGFRKGLEKNHELIEQESFSYRKKEQEQ
jgi:hypothetical protein